MNEDFSKWPAGHVDNPLGCWGGPGAYVRCVATWGARLGSGHQDHRIPAKWVPASEVVLLSRAQPTGRRYLVIAGDRAWTNPSGRQPRHCAFRFRRSSHYQLPSCTPTHSERHSSTAWIRSGQRVARGAQKPLVPLSRRPCRPKEPSHRRLVVRDAPLPRRSVVRHACAMERWMLEPSNTGSAGSPAVRRTKSSTPFLGLPERAG